jgi:hypothetical protein
MKKIEIFSVVTLLLAVCTCMESCRVIGTIFKAGVWAGIFLIVAIVGLILFLLSRIGSGKS